MKTPYFEGDKLTAGELQWIIDAIHHEATNGLAEEDLPNLPFELQDGTSDPLGRNFASAAWCLREIAHAAIDRLDRLPADALREICSRSEAWPVLIRPKVSTSAKRAGIRVEELGLGTKLPLDLDHTTASESGEKVPVGESIWPGIGLARRLHEVLQDAKKNEGLDEATFAGYPSDLVCAADPDTFSDLLACGIDDEVRKLEEAAGATGGEGSGQKKADAEFYSKLGTKRGREVHRLFLIATLPDLTPETARHWALAGLRYLQCENGGFLVHDICSDENRAPTEEMLSNWIPKTYWEATKKEAANAGRSAIQRLEKKVETALRKGFGELARAPEK
jgi:hypothetical protein